MLKDNSQLKLSLSPYQGIYDAIFPIYTGLSSTLFTKLDEKPGIVLFCLSFLVYSLSFRYDATPLIPELV